MRASGREFIQKANGMLRGGARVIPMNLMQGCPPAQPAEGELWMDNR